MPDNEIEIPREVREFMPENAIETFLGQKNGAKKQYRYGLLHIREYEDKFLVHMDKVDPREDPLGHLIKDAPEFIVGATCSFLAAKLTNDFLKKNNLPKSYKTFSKISSALVCGYLGYLATKNLKKQMEK